MRVYVRNVSKRARARGREREREGEGEGEGEGQGERERERERERSAGIALDGTSSNGSATGSFTHTKVTKAPSAMRVCVVLCVYVVPLSRRLQLDMDSLAGTWT